MSLTASARGHCDDRRRLSSCLRFTGETGRSYEGQYDAQPPASDSFRYRLQAEGQLMPAATAREDPVLYVLLYASLLSPITPAYGSGDRVQLDIVWPRDSAGFVYSLELEGPDHLVGRRGSDRKSVDLRKEDGVWSGMFGFNLYLQAGTAEPLGNGEIEVTLQSARWRMPHRYVIRPTADGGVELSGRGGWDGAQHARSSLSADATTLTRGHCDDRRRLSSCLRFTGETGRSYEGQYDGRQNGNSRRYRLQAEGHLMPVATAREDPVLYVLLYALMQFSECPQCGRTPFADTPARSVLPSAGWRGTDPPLQ